MEVLLLNKYWDLRYLKIALYAVMVVVISILTYRISSNTDNIFPTVYAGFKSFMSIFSSIMYGLLIAYLMNPAMGFFERYLVKWTHPTSPQQFKHIRILCIITVYICLFSTIFFSIKFLVPEILSNLKVLFTNLPVYLEASRNLISEWEKMITSNLSYPEIQDILQDVLDPTLITNFFSVSNITSFLEQIISSTLSLTSVLLDWIIGFVIAIYALMQKETFINGTQRLTYALFKQSTANKIIALSSDSHYTITKFFVGKSVDSLIIGLLCFIGLSLMKNPYALLLSLIVGVCNMIPYFGPFIGAVPAVILTLFEGIPSAIFVALFILLLQQFDGLYLGPKILGESIGITPFWIISAIAIGGSLWGPLGMFFGSPILAVILNTINKWVDTRLSQKSIHLPKLSPDAIIPTLTPPTTSVNPFKKKKKSH